MRPQGMTAAEEAELVALAAEPDTYVTDRNFGDDYYDEVIVDGHPLHPGV